MDNTIDNLHAPTTGQISVLQDFRRAVRRESYILRRQPELLWQQLYNRLQWMGPDLNQVLKAQLEGRSAAGGRPWLRSLVPYRESQALLSTLSGHTREVN